MRCRVPFPALDSAPGGGLKVEAMDGDAHDLMPIGRFSEHTALTVKALRLYDKVGLLRPAVVDMSSGYRYYSPDQVETAELIKQLRSAEMPLEEIRAILQAGDPEVIRARLGRHRERIKGHMAVEQRCLDLLKALDRRYERMAKERTMKREKPEYECSFCGKSASQVQRMIAGPRGVYICNECVVLCNEIIAEEEGKPVGKA